MRRRIMRAYGTYSQGQDALKALGIALKVLYGVPALGGALGYIADGLIGALLGAAALLLGITVIVVLAAVLAARRLPIHIEVIPDPMTLNGVTASAWVRVDGRKLIYSAALWCHLKANNYGHHDLRITGLTAEFRRLKWGFWPNLVASVRCRKQTATETDINWLLPAAGQPQVRISSFADQPMQFGERLDMAEALSCKVIAEVGSPTRRVYAWLPEEVELMA